MAENWLTAFAGATSSATLPCKQKKPLRSAVIVDQSSLCDNEMTIAVQLSLYRLALLIAQCAKSFGYHKQLTFSAFYGAD